MTGNRDDSFQDIFKCCDAYVIISGFVPENEGETVRWHQYLSGISKNDSSEEHLKCLAIIDSVLEDNGDEKIYSDSGAFLKGKMILTDNSRIYKYSTITEVLASCILKESGYSLGERLKLSLNKLNGIALSHHAGTLRTETIEGFQIPRTLWRDECINKVYEIISFLVLEDNGKTNQVQIEAVQSLPILCASLKCLFDVGINNVSVYDITQSKYISIKEFSKKDFSKEDILQYQIVDGDDGIFLNIDIKDPYSMLIEDKDCYLPKIDESKPLFLSGRIPYWFMGTVVANYHSPSIYVLQSPKGFVCVSSQEPNKLGTYVNMTTNNITNEGEMK